MSTIKGNTQKKKRSKSKIEYHRITEVMELRNNMSAQELADLIDTNPGHMSRILNAKRPCISLPIAIKISKALKTPVEHLFFLTRAEYQEFRIKNKK